MLSRCRRATIPISRVNFCLQVVVEYSPADVDAFIAFADAVEEEFQGIIVDGVEVSSAGNVMLGAARNCCCWQPASVLCLRHVMAIILCR